jgi:hypothetical protein
MLSGFGDTGLSHWIIPQFVSEQYWKTKTSSSVIIFDKRFSFYTNFAERSKKISLFPISSNNFIDTIYDKQTKLD